MISTGFAGGTARSDTHRWNDPALQALERWLREEMGLPHDRVAEAVDGVWVFYSYRLLPIVFRAGKRSRDGRPPMGIAVASDRRAFLNSRTMSAGGVNSDARTGAVGLFLPEPEWERAISDRDPIRALSAAFGDELAHVGVSMHLTLVSPRALPSLAPHIHSLGLGEEEKFRYAIEDRFRFYLERITSDRRRITSLGVFVDDLGGELESVFGSDLMNAWLQAPNAQYGGSRPVALLGTQGDRALRDLVLAAKSGMPWG